MANGGVVPEVTPWLPLLGAVGLYGYFLLRRPSPAGTRAQTHA